jgi:meso-butanediol dehydrogenase/(S,S)-butanediol dehydrogenase/diacetyl reductase
VSLEGKAAVVTGAGSGIGRASAIRFAEEGALVTCVDVNGGAAEETASAIGERAVGVGADVSDAAAVASYTDDTVERWGQLDVVFNNAGIAGARPLLDVTEDDWDRMLNVNLRAVFFVLQGAARRMRQQSPMPGSELRGKLIQTASIAAYRGGQMYMVHYAASKAGVISVTRTAAQVLAPYKITSNCICPGVVDTPMWKKIDADWAEIEGWELGEAWKRRIALIPLGRPEKPDDVAGVVSFLVSRDSDYMTGQAVHIDGGLVMGN